MPPRTRRGALRLLCASAAAATLAGCSGEPPGETATPSASPEPTAEVPDPPARGLAERVAVELTVTDEPGYDDGFRYFASNRTVRQVTVRSGGEPTRFETTPAATWASFRAAEAAQERVRAVVADRIGTSAFGSGVGRPPAGSDAPAPAVTLRADPADGAAPYPAVVRAAPREAATRVTVDGDTYSQLVPVFVEVGQGDPGGE